MASAGSMKELVREGLGWGPFSACPQKLHVVQCSPVIGWEEGQEDLQPGREVGQVSLLPS